MANNTTNLDQVSLSFMSSIFQTNINLIISNLIDFLCCCLCLKIFFAKSTPFKSKIFIVVRAALINDLMLILYFTGYVIWHISNYILGKSEVMPIKFCFYIVSPQTIFKFIDIFLQLSIAFDRMVAIKWPLKHTKRGRRFYRLMIVVRCILGCVSATLMFFDKFDPGELLIYCSARVALGKLSQYAYWVIMVAIGALALLILLVSVLFISWYKVIAYFYSKLDMKNFVFLSFFSFFIHCFFPPPFFLSLSFFLSVSISHFYRANKRFHQHNNPKFLTTKPLETTPNVYWKNSLMPPHVVPCCFLWPVRCKMHFPFIWEPGCRIRCSWSVNTWHRWISASARLVSLSMLCLLTAFAANWRKCSRVPLIKIKAKWFSLNWNDSDIVQEHDEI